MQNGSVIRAERQRGPDVWEFRWREPGADGKRRHRRMVLGSVEQLGDEAAARQAIAPLKLEFNRGGAWLKMRSASVSDLVSHYRERELDPDTVWKTHSTKVTYEGYLNRWILPRWESYPLVRVNAGEVELWLRSLPLARSSCAKIRNLMSVVFNHGIRHEICDRNPIQLVRQSAKRKAVPVILSASEVHRLLVVLGVRERTLALLAFGTGLRMSELFWSKVARYRLPEKRDQRHTLHRVSSRWPLQDGGITEAGSPRLTPCGGSQGVAQSHKVQKGGRLGIREPSGAREKAVLGAVPHKR
jgi:hypothetical protein